MLSQNRTIPSAVAKQDNSECCRKTGQFRAAVAKQDNSESEMVSYALPYIKAGIAVMARNVQFCGARCMSAVAV